MDSSNTAPACPSDDDKPLQLQLCVKPLIALATALALGVSVLCLNFEYSIIFPHLYYIPIIIVCAFFPRVGIWFTAAIALVYVALVFGVTRDAELLAQALFRAIFFLIIGAVMTYLTRKRSAAEEALSFERKNLAAIVDEQTDCIARELEQSKRLENAYRAATEYYDRLMNQANAAIVIWNSGSYITRTNAVFERIAGKPKTELLGRKVSAIMPLDEAALRSPDKPVILPAHKPSGTSAQVLWTFTEIYASEQTEPFAYLAIGQELS